MHYYYTEDLSFVISESPAPLSHRSTEMRIDPLTFLEASGSANHFPKSPPKCATEAFPLDDCFEICKRHEEIWCSFKRICEHSTTPYKRILYKGPRIVWIVVLSKYIGRKARENIRFVKDRNYSASVPIVYC